MIFLKKCTIRNLRSVSIITFITFIIIVSIITYNKKPELKIITLEIEFYTWFIFFNKVFILTNLAGMKLLLL